MQWAPCLIMLALGGTPAEATTLKGERHAGELTRLTAEALVLEGEGGPVEIPLADLLDIRLTGSEPFPPAESTALIEVRLGDGTTVMCAQVAVEGTSASLETPHLGNFSVPLNSVSSIRLRSADSKTKREAWDDLRNRDIRRDLLVIEKERILDHLDGFVGDISAESVRFRLEGNEIPVPRQRVFGIVYFRRETNFGKPICELELTDGGRVRVREVHFSDDVFRGTLLDGAEVQIAPGSIRSLDFSLGKVKYLSDMEPRSVKYTPYFDVVWKYRRDRNLDGGPIRLGGVTYARGLAIHSRTELVYRIAGEYSRFKAIMGIDQAVGRKGDVRVVIRGDDTILFEGDVRGTDEPKPLDLDVTGVRDLEILVDFGGDLDIADHLDLAEARLVK